MKTFLKILLFIIGFPALIGLAIFSSISVFQNGITYGVFPFAGVLVLALFFIAYLITFIVTEVKLKKKSTLENAKKGMIALVLVAFIFTGGLWLVIDVLLPDILDDATSGTLLFDDVREYYDVQAEINGGLLTTFITRNYENGNLDDSLDLEDYLAQGYRNEDVKFLIHNNFRSLDKNGYQAFMDTGPWISLADDDRLTIPVLIHLLFNETEYDAEIPFYLEYDRIPKEVGNDNWSEAKWYYNLTPRENPEEGVTWSVLDMAGSPMEINLGGLFAGIEDPTLRTIIIGAIESLGPSLVATLRDIVADPDVVGAPVYLSIIVGKDDIANTALSLVPTNEVRGVLDYKANAWLDSNHLLMAVISLFPIRFWLYMWGAIVIAISVAIGAIRMKQVQNADGELEDSEEEHQDFYQQDRADDFDDSIYKTPYEKAYFQAQSDRIQNK